MMRSGAIVRIRSLGAQLDELLASRFLPRRWADRIWSAESLPKSLQHVVRNLAPRAEWRAYQDEDRIFFAVGHEHRDAIDPAGMASLELFLMDSNAAIYSAGVWGHDRESGWWLDSVLDATYDSEHGWWFDGITNPSPYAAAVVAPQFLALPPPAGRSPSKPRRSSPRA
ncbi:MAG: hypothetical protein ABI771_16725 [Betaproteobacteria bacterium]